MLYPKLSSDLVQESRVVAKKMTDMLRNIVAFTGPVLTSLLTLMVGPSEAAGTSSTNTGNERSTVAKENPMQRVEVNGKSSLEDANSGVVKRIVTRAELENIPSTNLLDAMRHISGVAINSSGRTSQISLNGLGGGYAKILVDGASPPPGFNLETIGISQIERIEISRVATAEQSGQAIAGVLNIVMRLTQATKLNELKTVGSGSGENDDYSLSYVRNERIGALANVLSAQVRSFYFNNTTFRTRVTANGSGQSSNYIENFDHVDSLSGNLSGRANWKLEENASVQVDYGGVFRRTDYESRELDRSASRTGSNSAPNVMDRSLRARVQYNEKLTSGVSYDIRASWGRAEQTEHRLFQSQAAGATEQINADRTDRSTLIGGTWRMSTEDLGKVSAGMEWDRSRRSDSNWQPLSSGTVANTTGAVDTTRASAFAQSDFDITTQMPAYLGLRYERIALDTNFVHGRVPQNGEWSDGQWSPVFQVKYRLTESNSSPALRAAVRRAYKLPTQDELSLRRRQSTINSPLSPDEIGNIDLKPESAYVYEVGFESPLQKWGMLSINLSHRKIEDVIQRILRFDGSRWFFAPTNLGSAIANGLDADVKASLQKVSKELPKIDLRASYGVYRSRIEALPFERNSLLQQLPWNASAAIDWQWEKLPVTVSLSYSKFGSKLVQLDERRTVGAPSIENVEIAATYRSPTLGVFRVGVTNASAPTIYLSDYFSDDGATVSQVSRYRRPAGIKLGWDLKF
ncbi:TonB-dependent receptor [Paucibacter sp. PLA-PC-4]|uniref:TonB-dependent receptor plug domain-containing protein n=1 Tax=Paucibacter sp. PLA-PC-4 TaxID=2993655 RepID=UPI00224A5318|nr:TonB-dependent receptor [Paucibacter sp. PLA-PC-4]MCX2864185.1 TonB-dependent receptor [Paucibacter sp. PLA-PC-4]